MAATAATAATGLGLLEKRIKATAIGSFVISVVVFLMGLGVLGVVIIPIRSKNWSQAAFMIAMGLICLFAAWASLSVGRSMWPATSSKLYKMFESGDTSMLAWAHLTVGKSNGVRLYLRNGEETSLSANRDDSAGLMTLIQQRCPGAILGYGPAQKKAYSEVLKQNRASATKA